MVPKAEKAQLESSQLGISGSVDTSEAAAVGALEDWTSISAQFYPRLHALKHSFTCLQAALWLVWKSGGDSKADVVLPIVLFSAHALLGNQWNGTGAHGLRAQQVAQAVRHCAGVFEGAAVACSRILWEAQDA